MSDKIAAERLGSQNRSELYFIEACGDDARRWMAEFCSIGTTELRLAIHEAMKAFKRHEIPAGLDVLSRVDDCLHTKVFTYVSIGSLLWRYRHAAKAYADYLTGDLAAAKANLDLAQRELLRVIGLHQFLLPLAIHGTDFIIQRARIARRERLWDEVKLHLDTIEEIFSGHSPYCVLDSGRPVLQADIRDFLESLPLDEKQRARTRQFLGEDSPVRDRVKQLEERIFSLPEMVIPYP